MRLILLCLILQLVACNPSGRRGQRVAGDDGQIDPILTDLSYKIDLIPTSIGEDIQSNEFLLPEDLKEGQKASISFLFSTTSNLQKVKFLSQGVGATCEDGEKVTPQYTLIELSEKPRVVYSGINVVDAYQLERDKNYAYVIAISETTCKDIKVSTSMWLGPVTMSVNYIKSCNYQSSTVDGGAFHFALNTMPPQASLYVNMGSTLFGENIICGKNISTANSHYTQDLSSGSVGAKIITNVDGLEVIYTYAINFEGDAGTILCNKGGDEFFRATLTHCQNKIIGVSSQYR